MMCKHMDDGVLVGPDESSGQNVDLTVMGKILLLKTSCPQLGSETKFLGRLLIRTARGFLVEILAKLFGSLPSCAGLEKCNPVHSPGVRSESRVQDDKPLLCPAEHSLYRTIVGKLVFIATERPNIQFCVKECARGVQKPFHSRHAESKAHLPISHGHSRLDIEAGTLEGCRHIANYGRQ